MTFDELKLEYDLLDGLQAMGFENATPIQEQAIPMIMDGRDLLACAQTGTGKTAAFLLPVLNELTKRRHKVGVVNTLIVVPTRELALQIDQQVEALGYFTGASSLAIYGGGSGSSWDQQKKALTRGADIIVATPGRFIAHMQMGYVKLGDVQHFILDEADRMLDMGFLDDLMLIEKELPKSRQNLMFSATMPPKIRQLTKKFLNNPEQINLAISKPAAGVLQAAYLVYDAQKLDLIIALLTGKKSYATVIIFCSTKKATSQVARALQRKNFNARSISSDLEQKERESVLQAFKSRTIQILVATDILARGIDIKEIGLVINYDVPRDAEDYVHRVGRTARADSTGVALTLINESEQYRFFKIEELIEQEIRKLALPEGFREGPVYAPKKNRGGGGGRSGGRNSGGKSYNKGGKKNYSNKGKKKR